MKRLIYSISICLPILISNLATSQSRSWQWAKRPDMQIAGYTYPAVSTDGVGNTYVAGAFTGTASFATVPIATTLISAGENDIFIAKYDAAGSVIWAKRLGNIHNESANAIEYDGFGNIYIAGSFAESTTFETTNLVSSSNSQNVFIAKFNASTGNLIWARIGRGVDGYDRAAFDIAVDNSGNAYMTGSIGGTTTTFDPLPALDASNRWWEIFVVKYSADGIAEWQTKPESFAAGYNLESGNGIAVDQSGNVFVTGRFNGSTAEPTKFGNINLVSNGGGGFYETDYFLAKYNPSSSSWEWAVNGGGTVSSPYSTDFGSSVSLDNSGNAYVSGVLNSPSSTFGATTISEPGYFIAKYTTQGNLSWVKSAGGVGYSSRNFSKVDGSGNFYFAGTFGGTTTVANQTLISQGFDNTFISGWNSNGDLQWLKHVPGDYYSQVYSLVDEPDGSIVYLSGFASTQTFDCTILSGIGYANMSISKLGTTSNGPDAPTIVATRNTVCNGSSTTLSIASGNLNNATEWKWYTGSCGGTLIGTGNSVTVSPSVATTYYVRGEGGCSAPGACASITINIGSVNVAIPDAKALNYNSIPNNTVYPAYSPASSITLTAQPSGTSPYNYSWSNGATTQSIIVSPTVTTTYNVTVTDGNGCTGTASKQVTVKDVNCGNGKIYMCHVTGNSGHVNTICIDNSAVATHLAAGCSLGECIGSRSAPSAIEAETTGFNVDVLPNPSNNYFNLVINTNDASPVSVRIMDVLGRVIELKENIPVSENYKFGERLKAGVYLAEIVQGKNRKVIRLLKK